MYKAIVILKIEGGLVQSLGIIGEGIPNQFVVIDYDCDGMSDEEVKKVPQHGGGSTDALVINGVVERYPEDATTNWIAGNYADSLIWRGMEVDSR